MWEKGTGDLEEELMSTDSIDSYIHDNEGYFFERSITEALEELYERKSVSKALLARQSGMSEVCISTRCSPGGAIRPGTGCCACASAWRPHWTRPSGC